MTNILELSRLIGTMYATLTAIKATGLKGRVVRGCRLWTPQEVNAILESANAAR